MEKTHYIRLPLKNAFNVRDLGGYACAPEGVTKWNTFIRGDDLSRLDREETDFLIAYGIDCVIDFRSPAEIKNNPDPFKNSSEVEYHNIPLMLENIADITKIVAEENLAKLDFSNFISKFYIGLIEKERALIKKTLEIMAETEGGVLFHCTVGKDRTGVIAAILLGIAGVNMADIIGNYEVTYTYNTENPTFDMSNNKIPLEVMYSKADYLKNAIDYVNTKFGSLINYLWQAGVEKSTIEKIKNKFVCTRNV